MWCWGKWFSPIPWLFCFLFLTWSVQVNPRRCALHLFNSYPLLATGFIGSTYEPMKFLFISVFINSVFSPATGFLWSKSWTSSHAICKHCRVFVLVYKCYRQKTFPNVFNFESACKVFLSLLYLKLTWLKDSLTSFVEKKELTSLPTGRGLSPSFSYCEALLAWTYYFSKKRASQYSPHNVSLNIFNLKES